MASMPLKNYYQILELSNFADVDQIKSAFRRLARQSHPDLNAGDAAHEERFKQINEAYDVLGSPDKKASYDEALRVLLRIDLRRADTKDVNPKDAQQKPETRSGVSAKAAEKEYKSQPKRPSPGKKKEDPGKKSSFDGVSTPSGASSPSTSNPSMGEFFGSFKKAFGQDAQPFVSSAAHTHTQGKPRRGQDVHVDAVINVQEAKEGVIKTVNVQHQDICKRCSGTGKVVGKICPLCQGQKIVTRLKKIDVRIPGGVKGGSKVRVSGEGGRGDAGGEAGDLFLQIQIQAGETPEPSRTDHLKIDGLDVYGELIIQIPDAVLGAVIEVPTLQGSVRLTVPPLSSSGRVLRLREHGVHNNGSKGDHYVTLRIVAPEGLSEQQKALYQELAKLQQRHQ